MLFSRELSYVKHPQQVSEPTWIYRSSNQLPRAAAMRLCKMGRLFPAFLLQLFSDKCGFKFNRKDDMNFLLRFKHEQLAERDVHAARDQSVHLCSH